MIRAAIFLAILALSAGAHAGSCQFAQRTFHSYAEIQRCLLQVPFSDELRQATLSNLRKTFDLYAFREYVCGNQRVFCDGRWTVCATCNIPIVKNSPVSGALSHIQVDLAKEFDRIASTSYQSDFDFQTDVADVVLALKDPHTVYQKGDCYSFFALQPFVLRSRLNSQGVQEIWISDLYFYATQWSGLNLQAYVNSTVVSIDGNPALQTLSQWAIENEFESKDPGSRFNRVLDSHYQQRIASIFPLPENSTQTFVVRDATGKISSVSIPWKVDVLSTMTFDSSCTAMSKSTTDLQLHSPIARRKLLRTRYPSTSAVKGKFTQRRQQRALFSPKADNPSIETFNLSSQVVVARIHDFEPQDSHAFLDTFDALLDYSQQANIPYLILDLRGNGGGSICLGYQLINRLMHERHPEGDYDVIKSAGMQALFEAGQKSMSKHDLFGPGFFSDHDGNVLLNLDWYNNARTLQRGGSFANYSQPVHHGCKYKDWPTDWLFKKVLIVTDGLCGSTCAVVSTHLADLDHVDTLVVGGLWGNKQQYFSFPGGQVMSYNNLLMYAQQLGLSESPLLPSALGNNAQQSFTFLEIYPWKVMTSVNQNGDDLRLATPLEFIFDPSDYRLPMWNFVDDDDIDLWNAITPFFSKSANM